MNKKGMGLLVFVAIFAFMIPAMPTHSQLPYGNILFVDDDFTNDANNNKFNDIQDAIDNATDGDIIYIFEGTYSNNIWINREVRIIGEGSDKVFIDGNGRDYAVNVAANNVTIENVTISNGAIGGIGIGIFSDNENIEIKNCVFHGNGEYGLCIFSDNISIQNCTIYNDPTAIFVKASNVNISECNIYNVEWGIEIENSSYCSIFNTEVHDVENKSVKVESSQYIEIRNLTAYSSFCGVWLLNTTNSSLNGCNISYNKIGVKIEDSSYNEIRDCYLIDNFGYGLYSVESYNNSILHNNFVGNGINAYDTGMNVWNKSIGNYWDDYTGTDANEDGIGDEPYEIGYNRDYRPLIHELSSHPMFVWVDDDFNASTPGWGMDHFDKIQDGVNALGEGGKCYVYEGYYTEGVKIEKRITLMGENATIDSLSDGIFVSADNVRIEGFTVYADSNGIKIQGADNVLITQCSAGGAIFGVYVLNAVNCSIENGEFYANMKGIYLFNVSQSVLRGNYIHNNSYFGMELSHGSSYNLICDSQIENNGNYGIYIVQDSNGNKIYHNNFINNPSYDACANQWGSTREDALGNYWSDYEGTDSNMDGMGDIPYSIEGGGMDMHPLMNPIVSPPLFVWVNKIYNSSYPGWDTDHFSSINDALTELADGGGCHIFQGVYKSNSIVEKSMEITGEGRDTVIEGNGETAFYIKEKVELRNMDIKDCWNDAGIKIEASNVSVLNCNLYDNYYGVVAKGGDEKIENCTIYDNSYTGILMEFTHDSSIKNCEIYGNNNGIMMRYSSSNLVEGNSVRDNFVHGMDFLNSNNNILHHNDFENNMFGLYMRYSSNNHFYFNNFIGNENHVYDTNANIWNNSVGNYWDDYTGTDANEDGIGDEPYHINGYGMDYRLTPLRKFISMTTPLIWMETLTHGTGILGMGM